MPIIRWKTSSSEKTFLKKKESFKNIINNNNKNINDFNLEIRPISSSSSSFGTESFLSYDSLYDGEQSDLANKKTLADVNGNNVGFEMMDFQEAPLMQSEEKIKEERNLLEAHGRFPLEFRIKKEMRNRQMFFTSLEDEQGEVNNFFYNIQHVKKESNETRSSRDGNICSFQSVQNKNTTTDSNENHQQTNGTKNREMISNNPPTKDDINSDIDRDSTKDSINSTSQADVPIRLRSDQFNKVSPLLPKNSRLDTTRETRHDINDNNDTMSGNNLNSEKLKTLPNETEKQLFSPLSRDHWIMFEDDSSTFDKDSSSFDESNAETKLIQSSDENDFELNNTRNKTKNIKNADETKLLADGLDSELSDEVISLDYESEEERKKLCDTPVKQFPDVQLFQASSVKNREALNLDLHSSNSKTAGNVEIDNDNFYDVKSLDDYPDSCPKNTWNFWYRYPDRKKKVGTRSWSPVSVTVERDFIKVNGETKNGSPILREIPLHPFYVFTIPRVHAGNREGKMFSVKLQYVKYKEIRKLKLKTIIEHLPIYTPVIKLATRDFISLREFIGKVETIIRHIPTYRDKGITYRHEEIFIDCDDECQYLLSGDGNALKSNITVQMRLRVFITGNPELKLYLNDVNHKDSLMKVKEGYSEYKSSKNWIRPINYEYHPCVDTSASSTDGCVIFLPPDGCSFELLRFRVPPRNKLPIIAKSCLEVSAGNSVRLTASIQVSGDAKNIRYKRSDVIVYFPIPPSWNVLFVRSRSLNGKRQYIKVNACRKTPLPSVASLNRVTLKVSTGVAKYEPAFGALVWKLGSLPIIQNGLAADAVHTFDCFIELPFALEMRDEFQPFTYVEFNVGHQLASGVAIEEILVSDGKIPDKWVCYRANYRYKVSMRLIENGKEKISPCR